MFLIAFEKTLLLTLPSRRRNDPATSAQTARTLWVTSIATTRFPRCGTVPCVHRSRGQGCCICRRPLEQAELFALEGRFATPNAP